MASCDLKTTNREYMISTGALEQGSRRIKNERLFDLKNQEIKDIANQRYRLSTQELPFTKTERSIPRKGKLASDYFVEWGFNDKFYEEITPIVEIYKDIEEAEKASKAEGISNQIIPFYVQTQISFEESINDDVIVTESPIRSSYPYEAEDYLADIQPETKANLNKLQFKEQECLR